MATVEFAVGFLSVAAVIGLLVGVFQAAFLFLDVHQAARVGAREALLGKDIAAIEEASMRVVPGSRVAVTRQGDMVTVEVAARASLGIDVHESVTAVREP